MDGRTVSFVGVAVSSGGISVCCQGFIVGCLLSSFLWSVLGPLWLELDASCCDAFDMKSYIFRLFYRTVVAKIVPWCSLSHLNPLARLQCAQTLLPRPNGNPKALKNRSDLRLQTGPRTQPLKRNL
ncbi:unnamed protein product, partial [Phaeothamnion confervicola]